MSKDKLLTSELFDGSSLIEMFNNDESDITLAEYIDIALSMVIEETASKQVELSVEALKTCELVDPNVKRIRLYEAMGAVIGSNIKNIKKNI